MQIAKLIGSNPSPRPDGNPDCFGLEFEVEGFSGVVAYKGSTKFQAKEDGSLRNNGAELVTGALSLAEAEQAVRDFVQLQTSGKYVHSPRTSTHVHINVRDLLPHELTYFLAVLLALEPALLRLTSPLRRANNFCVPQSLCPDERRRAVDMGAGRVQLLRGEKYCAVGLHRLRDLGTVEYRALAGCQRPELVLCCIRVLLACKVYVRGADTQKVRAGVNDLGIVLGAELYEELRSLQLSGEVPTPEYLCRDMAMKMLLDLEEATPLLSVGAPSIPQALAQRLQELPLGGQAFGFERQGDELLHMHEFNGVVVRSTYKLRRAKCGEPQRIILRKRDIP